MMQYGGAGYGGGAMGGMGGGYGGELPPPPPGVGAAAAMTSLPPPPPPTAGGGGALGGGQQSYLNLQRYHIREHIQFDRQKRHGPIIILVGKRNTGKSMIVRDICWAFRNDVKHVMVMSGTERESPFFGDFVPANCIHIGFNSNQGALVVAEQRQKCASFYERLKNNDPACTQEDHRLMWIIDDCMYDESWARTELMRFIFTCGRHVKIFLLVTMQYPLGIPPALRGNIDAVFLTRDIGSNVRKLFDTYGNAVFDNFEEFKFIFSQATKDYRAMVLSLNDVNADNLNSLVFFYRAENHPHFRMGSQADWEKSEQLKRDPRRRQMQGAQPYQAGMNKPARAGGSIAVFHTD